MKRRLRLAAWLDRREAQIRRVGERVGWPQQWLQEFAEYLHDPRLTLEEFYVTYALLRRQEVPKMRAITTELEAREFYRTSQYPMWRNLVHRRHSAWRRVLWTMKGRWGWMMEFGCGIAPITAYVRPRKPWWGCWPIDVDGPSLDYARWRAPLRYGTNVYDVCIGQPRNVITAIDVFEHLPDPEQTARDLVGRLAPGGFFHWNFVSTENTQLDLATPAQREKTIAYLKSTLRTVYEGEGYVVSRKR